MFRSLIVNLQCLSIVFAISMVAFPSGAQQRVSRYTQKTVQGNLVIYQPMYSRVDLVCGTMPSKDDTSVLFTAEATFTAKCQIKFSHTNVMGDHVSGGKKYKSPGCKRFTGAFVYYSGTYKFLYGKYGEEFDKAAAHGGMGFRQEMMIHGGKRVPTTRKNSNKNEFRALCEKDGKLCIIDSKGRANFGDFISNLLKAGVTEAIYLDMGRGWNYSWWRDCHNMANEIHSLIIPFTTNWITFYK